jgi:hypothetical protein
MFFDLEEIRKESLVEHAFIIKGKSVIMTTKTASATAISRTLKTKFLKSSSQQECEWLWITHLQRLSVTR